MHNLIFRSRGRSYRELPLRFFEFGSVYRYEKSGVVHGLTRVRGLTQDDSHSYVTPEQAPGEIRHLLAFVLGLLRDFGLDDYYLELSTRGDDPEKQPSSSGPTRSGRSPPPCSRTPRRRPAWSSSPDPGGAAFYGPKISVQARDAIGRTWQMSTIQYDFNQPARFGLEYTSADGGRAAAGDDPLGQVRLDRAVLRRPHRALRRRLPGLAGAGAGGRHPDHRRAGALPDRRRAAAAGARASGSRSTTPTTGCRRRSAPPASRRSRSC